MERHRVEEETQKKAEKSPASRWLNCCKGILQKLLKDYIFLLRLFTERVGRDFW